MLSLDFQAKTLICLKIVLFPALMQFFFVFLLFSNFHLIHTHSFISFCIQFYASFAAILLLFPHWWFDLVCIYNLTFVYCINRHFIFWLPFSIPNQLIVHFGKGFLFAFCSSQVLRYFVAILIFYPHFGRLCWHHNQCKKLCCCCCLCFSNFNAKRVAG